jgi:hypothetical protein
MKDNLRRISLADYDDHGRGGPLDLFRFRIPFDQSKKEGS